MRRTDREITDKKTIEEFISDERIIRIAFYDNGEIYIVPVNYGYCLKNDSYSFYFHGAKAGRKYELAKSSPEVGFEIDGQYKVLEADTACGHSARFRSVVGTGRLCIVDNKEEKIFGLDHLMRQAAGGAEWIYDDAMLARTAVFRLDADKLSCKAKQ